MTEPAQHDGPRGEDRLDSWKEIAAYLKRDVRTVRRWESEIGLPVRRLGHGQRSRVYAYRREIDAWLEARGSNGGANAEPNREEEPRKRPTATVLAAAAGLCVVAVLLGLSLAPREDVRPKPEVRQITSLAGYESYPSLSPDGTQVAFAWRPPEATTSDIYVQVVGAGDPLRVTDHPGRDFSPAWSPDGRHLAFLRWTDGDFTQIVVKPALGGQERTIAEGYVPWDLDLGAILSWTPDSRYVTAPYSRERTSDFALQLLAVEGGEIRALTTLPATGGVDTSAAFSRDASRMLFARLTSREVSDIYVCELGPGFKIRGRPRRLTDRNVWTSSPRFVSQDREALFISGQLGRRRVYRMPVDGRREPEAVTTFPSDIYQASLSAKGDRLAFVQRSHDTNAYAVDLENPDAAIRPVLRSSASDSNASFSPDGSTIVFDSARSGANEIWKALADGSRPEQLTSLGRLSGSARYSPDGRWIAFDSRSGERSDIYVMPAEGGEPRALTRHEADDVLPVWHPGGDWIYFGSRRGGRWEIWRKAADGSGEAEQVTRNGGLQAEITPDGAYLYYTAPEEMEEDAVWRMRLDGEGEPQRVLDPIYWYCSFAVAKDRVYYVPKTDPPFGPPMLMELDLETGERRPLLEMEQPLSFGFALSPDGKQLLFSRYDQIGADLMMMEGL